MTQDVYFALWSSDMDLLYFFTGAFVFFVALIRRELLIEKQTFTIVLGVSVALFLAGIALHFTAVGRYSMSGALLAPLLTLWLFTLCRKLFIMQFKHEPRDTFLDWQAGMGEDRVFNIVYLALAILLVVLSAVGMEKLAKMGW